MASNLRSVCVIPLESLIWLMSIAHRTGLNLIQQTILGFSLSIMKGRISESVFCRLQQSMRVSVGSWSKEKLQAVYCRNKPPNADPVVVFIERIDFSSSHCIFQKTAQDSISPAYDAKLKEGYDLFLDCVLLMLPGELLRVHVHSEVPRFV